MLFQADACKFWNLGQQCRPQFQTSGLADAAAARIGAGSGIGNQIGDYGK
jgi:hypothetical protein